MWERARAVLDRHPTGWDAAIAIACFLATVAGHGAVQDPRPIVLFFAAVSALPLTWRRRAPFPVAAVCGAGSIGLIAVHGFIDWPYGQLVATYTVAATSSFPARAVLVAGTVIGIAFTQQTLSKPPGSVLTSGGVFTVAFALGIGARARGDRIALLEERALRHDEERAAAAARERERIARDMHDILAHSISMIAVQAEAGPLLVHRDPDRAARAFDAISGTAHDALTQLRRTLGVLRGGPDDRAPQPGLESLPALAGRARETGLAVTVTSHGEPVPAPPEVAVAVYRVVQESLTNVVRHAGATAARVGLTWSATSLRVAVADDGRGAAAATPSAGHGLIGMRERVSACGGTFTAGTGRTGGFTVTATFPLSGRPAAAAPEPGGPAATPRPDRPAATPEPGHSAAAPAPERPAAAPAPEHPTAAPEPRLVAEVTESRPAAEVTESRPAADITESRPAADITESRPAADITESRPAAGDRGLRRGGASAEAVRD
ncbi:signal transduction histidine kinase [Catenuloplanes nepalensis]|uniref:histidine kinase n=1 Tax=Catenuloplanes nepalensis TaxID=587533 RepID=A0ABT9N0J7_9ACTN|nr:histidine kinase [Catenuloplanes nepalensis]MDP9797219.1 signal transduction histidine kinase [Catenuloplanes nepalensis]